MPGRHKKIEGAELLSIAERLLVVIADDLVELSRAAGRRADRPVREAFVQLGPQLLRDACIRSIPNQRVAEPVPVLTAWARCEQILARQAEQSCVHVPPLGVVR